MDKGKLKGIREFILLRSRFLSIQRFDLSISSAKKDNVNISLDYKILKILFAKPLTI